MGKIVSYILLAEVIGLIGFIFAAQYQEVAQYRYLVLLIALVAVIYVAYLRVGVISYKNIIFIAITVSAVFVIAVQFLGFTLYPGLVKDIDFLSMENATRMGLIMMMSTVGHFLLFILIRKFHKTPN